MNADSIKTIQKVLLAVNIFYMGRACKACCKYDAETAAVFAQIRDGFVARIGTAPGGAEIFVRSNDGEFEVCSPDRAPRPDLDIRFKNSDVARKFFSGQKSLAACFSQGLTMTGGDTSQLMTLSRFFDLVANYIMTKNFLRRNGRPLLKRNANVHKLRFVTLFGRL